MKLFRRDPVDRHDYELADVLKTAAEGRRLAIYDVSTNLLAYWYVQLRGDEEIARAKRYTKPLSVVCVWASTQGTVPALAARLHERLRDTDLAGYLNNGHFVIILTETAIEGAQMVLERLVDDMPADVDGTAVTYPGDGVSFDELLASAKRIASDNDQQRAS